MKILDTTIRDGSYAVDFKFSCDDVSTIVERLEKLGVEYIEIGHGQGLNASSYEHGIALHTDVEYMQAAKRVVKNSKIGFFCIPGIARIEDIKIACENGVSFIRIGVTADNIEKALPYIHEAKLHNIEVMVNFMKTYTVSPDLFAQSAKIAKEAGAEYVYVVDSAGGMLPEELYKYYEAVKQNVDIKVGFHGHNNLGLAVSNSIYCAQNGYDIIDCSLQGLGRSLGNASTEMFVMAMEKLGYDTGFDIPRLLEYGYVSLRDISKKELQNPLDLVCGYANFHSGYLKDIYKCCNLKNVDPLRLIIEYSKYDTKSMDFEKLCEVADRLPKDFEIHPYHFRNYFTAIYNI